MIPPRFLHLVVSAVLPFSTVCAADTSTWVVRPDASLHLGFAQPSLAKVTHRTLSHGGSLGITTRVPGTENEARLGFTFNWMPGSWHGTAKSSLTHRQFFADAFFNTRFQGLRWFLGISGNRYQLKNEGTETWVPSPVSSSYQDPGSVWALTPAEVNGKGRAGVRAGLSYRHDRHLATEFTFQTTELAVRAPYFTPPPDMKYRGSVGPVNPAWFQLGVRYTY